MEENRHLTILLNLKNELEQKSPVKYDERLNYCKLNRENIMIKPGKIKHR